MLLTTFSWSYTSIYHYSSGAIGLCYLIYVAGTYLGVQVYGRWSDSAYRKETEKGIANGQEIPERRLNYHIFGFGFFLLISSLIAYGWTIQEQVHPFVPIMLTFFSEYWAIRMRQTTSI